MNGQPARVTLGVFPSVTVEQAQQLAREMQGQIAAGVDPRAARRVAREEPTIAGLFSYWLESHAKQHKRTWEADERQYNTYLKPWGSRKLSTIRKADVRALQLRIASGKGRYIANKVLTLLRSAYNRAFDIGYTGGNPTAGIKKFPRRSGIGFSTATSAPSSRHWPAIERHARDYFLFCLLTGVRKAMRWPHVGRRSTSPPAWRIPKPSGQPVVAARRARAPPPAGSATGC